MQSRAALARSLSFLVAGLTLLALILAGTLLFAGRQDEETSWVEHTLVAQNRISGVLQTIQEAENGQRGYMLLADASYLQPYSLAAGRIDSSLDELAVSVADNTAQMEALARLRPLVAQRMDVIRKTIEMFGAGDIDGAVSIVRSGEGREIMDEIRSEVLGMLAEEQRLLVQRRDAAAATAGWLRLVLIAGFALVVALGLLALRNARQRLRETFAARDSLAAANSRLVAEAASREQAEAQVRQMQKMESVGQLTGGIAHDFNNMLAIIIGSLDMAKRRLKSDPGKAEIAIGHAADGAQRAAALTNRLLAFSRQQPLAPTVCDPNRLVSGMSELLHRTLGEHIELETVLAGGLWRAYADCPQIENAILNLCVNARDAMPDGGKLTIETANSYLDDAYAAQHAEVIAGQYVTICVTDTGMGMPPEVIARAFDPFYTTKGVGKGTGLGLAQVFGFVKQSGGHVKIYSEINQGTTVKIYLPRWTGVEEASAEEEILPTARGGSEIILVVEDDDAVRRISVDVLRELGYTVIHASSGLDALQKFDANPRIDLLFTDIVMPGMTGRVLADAVSAQRPDLKVLYTTGYTRNAVVHNGMLDRGVALLPKPFTMDQLAVKVRQVLDGAGVNRPV